MLASSPAWAAWHERWTASSTAALSITGDATLYGDRIVFAAGPSLSFTRGRNIYYADGGSEPEVAATTYQITRPVDPPMLRGNTICGMGPITYFVIWHSTLQGRGLAAFTGQAAPVSGGAGHCATLYYEAGK